MSILRLNGITKGFEKSVILRDVHFSLDPGEKVGLIGKNGSGKTTVLKLILGLETPDSGTMETDDGIRTGYFSQFSELKGALSITETLDSLFTEVHAVRKGLESVEKDMAENPVPAVMDRLINRQAELHETMLKLDGWDYTNRIETVLDRLEFPAIYRTCPVDSLSGGWKNRAALAKILLEEPDLLLLDEPTNFLDTDGMEWLEGWLKKSGSAALVVSHDRDFLNNTVSRLIEIENNIFQEYRGNFTYYVREKQTRLRLLEKQFEHEQELLICEANAIEDISELRRTGDRKVKRKLADVHKLREPRPVDTVFTDVYELLKIRTELGRFIGLCKTYEGRTVFKDVSFELQKDDRIVIIGPNGCGKSTLLRLLNTQEEPDRGEVRWLSGSEIADFGSILAGLDPSDTVTHFINIAPLANKASRKRVNRFLELMRFSEADMNKRIGTLSGGLKARTALARCLLSGSPVILLDEPTNHLDITTCQVMERALINFPGAVIAASHDRFFIDKVATRLLVFGRDGTVSPFDGNWSQWHNADKL